MDKIKERIGDYKNALNAVAIIIYINSVALSAYHFECCCTVHLPLFSSVALSAYHFED